jgi:hypothetical protein
LDSRAAIELKFLNLFLLKVLKCVGVVEGGCFCFLAAKICDVVPFTDLSESETLNFLYFAVVFCPRLLQLGLEPHVSKRLCELPILFPMVRVS